MKQKSRSRLIYSVLLLVPALIFIVTFMIVPLIKTIYYSFTAWYNFSQTKTFIGLANYKQFFTDPVIKIALRNTMLLIVFALIFQVGVALILAICVDAVPHGFKFFRTVYFFPIVISATAIGLMFSLIYKYDYGLLNYIVQLFGGEPQVWLTKERSIYMLLVPVCWQFIGFYFVVYLTAIANIPGDIYESAVLDGVKPLQKAIYITVPMLKSTLTANIVLVVSGCFRVFDMVYVITGGGPMNSSQLLSSYMYYKAFADYNTGYASALAIIMMALGLTITGIMKSLTNKISSDD